MTLGTEVPIIKADEVHGVIRHRVCGGEVVFYDGENICRSCGQWSRSMELMSSASGTRPRRVVIRPGAR